MIKIYLFFLLVLAWNAEVLGGPATRILGGQQAPEGAFPYVVSLRATFDYVEYEYCAGSIIRPEWVLTAAHCVFRFRSAPANITVYPGVHRYRERGTRYRGAEVIIHEDYQESRFLNDISLVRTASEMQFNEKVGAVALPDQDTPPGTDGFVTGWGWTNRYGERPYELQMLYVQTIPVEDCQKQLARFADKITVTEKNLCTYLTQRTGICQGDFGAGLVTDNKIVGVAAWANTRRCDEATPDVFVRVFSYVDWILGKIDGE